MSKENTLSERMNLIERYDLVPGDNNCDLCQMDPDPDGHWVSYEAYSEMRESRDGHHLDANRYKDELERLEAKVERLTAIVSAQAGDEGLWFNAETAPEAYLQQELRKLHAAVEALSEDT